VRTLRLLGFGYVLYLRMYSQSAFDGFLAVLWPLFFSTVVFFMYGAGRDDPAILVYAALGAAVMGVWTATSVPASAALQRQRWQGTLELLAAAPAHFGTVLLPMTIATATIGLYCIVATLLWSRFLFGIELAVAEPLVFAAALAATILSIGMLGFLMAVSFVRYRTSWAIGAASEYPVWLICGFLVPLSLLPDWVRPISWALAPTWGVDAIREAALGGSAWLEIALALGLGALYIGLGVVLVGRALEAARTKATLALS
jgi:ABC-2 type transport system permease protein